MSSLVVDASALVDLAARPAILEFIFAEHDVSAPALVVWEVGHVVHRSGSAFGDRKTQRRLVAALLRDLRLLDQRDRTDAMADLVASYKLSFYDAGYLQAALDEGAPLLTEDKSLLAAAKKALGPERAWTIRDAAIRAGQTEG